MSDLGKEFSAVIDSAFEYDCFMTGVQIGWDLIPERAL